MIFNDQNIKQADSGEVIIESETELYIYARDQSVEGKDDVKHSVITVVPKQKKSVSCISNARRF